MQHNQDLREIYNWGQILEFITFYHNALHLTTLHQNALHLTTVHCATFTRMHCATNNSNKNTMNFGGWERTLSAAYTQSFLSGKFFTARLEVLTNLSHVGVFQMSTMVNLGIGFKFESLWLVQALNLTRRWAFAPRPRNTGDLQIPAC